MLLYIYIYIFRVNIKKEVHKSLEKKIAILNRTKYVGIAIGYFLINNITITGIQIWINYLLKLKLTVDHSIY